MRTLLLLCLAGGITACSPTLNWREVRPEGSGAVLMLPCKPDSHARRLQLAGAEVRLTLHACSAGGVVWALGHADVDDPARVAPALAELRASALANIGAADGSPLPLAVSGATPNPASGRWTVTGRLPDGRAVQEQLAVFVRGTRVYQATAVGAALPPEAVETFFGALQTPP